MFSYLEKFKKLPKELQAIVSSPQATGIINELEEKYGIELASLAIKIMVKEISWKGLENVLVSEHNLTQEQAVQLKQELEQKIFYQVTKYLGIQSKVKSQKLESTTTNDEKQKSEQQIVNSEKGYVNNVKSNIESNNSQKNIIKIDKEKKVESINQGDIEMERVVNKSAEAIGFNKNQELELGRLKSIIRTFKKGIRDDLDTIDTLKKNIDAGGLSLSEVQAEQIVKIVNGGKILSNEKIPLRQGYEGQAKKPIPHFNSVEQMRDVEYDLSALEKKVESQKVHKVESTTTNDDKLETNKLKTIDDDDNNGNNNKKNRENRMPIPEFTEEELEHELAPPPLTIRETSPPPIVKKLETTDDKLQVTSPPASLREALRADNKEQTTTDNEKKGFTISPEKLRQAEKSIMEQKAKVEEQGNTPIQEEERHLEVRMQRPRIINDENKPQVNDIIRPKKRLEGPIEELANLDLINFRRLSDNPENAMKKVKQKIDLLEQESFTKRHQGINAWRHSQVYQVYINLGQESIKQGISVNDVIKKRESSGEEVLTVKEFNAILELNRKLRA